GNRSIDKRLKEAPEMENMTVKNHLIGQFYTQMAEGRTPKAGDLREFGISTDAMKTRVRSDRKILHEVWQAGERNEARRRGLELAGKFLETFDATWEEPEMESPRELAAKV